VYRPSEVDDDMVLEVAKWRFLQQAWQNQFQTEAHAMHSSPLAKVVCKAW
jgi:hypothetical protein